jgi:hypothetical protein
MSGDIIIESSSDKIYEIDVNDENDTNTNSPDDLFNVLMDPDESRLHVRSKHNDMVDNRKSQDGQPHQDNSGGLKETQDSESLQSPREGDQDD